MSSVQPIMASVRYTAIGSLSPDSISRVAATRSLSFTPDDLSSANTAAASVEPTMAPMSRAKGRLSPSSHQAAKPVTAVETTTPSVASHKAGLSPVRKDLRWVRSPPSSKITASATLPTQNASLKSSNGTPPGPSTPSSMPATKNTSKNENPSRVENMPASRLIKTSPDAMSRGIARKSSEKSMSALPYQKFLAHP